MFVATGARTLLLERRREQFARQYLAPLMAEATKLGMDVEQLKKMIDASVEGRGGISSWEEAT